MKKRAFTIVELLMVIAVISVLITITTGAVTGSMRSFRARRADAICNLVKQGLCTYHAQKGVWPWGEKPSGVIEDDGYYWLSESEVKDAVLELVKESKKHNPMMDISGLFVSTQSGEPGKKNYGMDFLTAVRGSKQHPKKQKASALNYGYPQAKNGYFRRFVIKYSSVTDNLIVRQYTDKEESRGEILEEGD